MLHKGLPNSSMFMRFMTARGKGRFRRGGNRRAL